MCVTECARGGVSLRAGRWKQPVAFLSSLSFMALVAHAEPQRLSRLVEVAALAPARADLRPAQRDPFESVPAVAVSVPQPPMVLQQPAVQAASIEPVLSLPTPTLTLAGRVRAADGRWLVVAQLEGGVPVTLEMGKELGNGYRVERVSDHVVELLNPKTQSLMQLAVPAAPRFETW